MRRAEGGAKIFGVFRVKNPDFTPKNHIFTNFRGTRPPGAPPAGSAPGLDGEFYVHVRYDMDLMINSNAYEILLIWFVVRIQFYLSLALGKWVSAKTEEIF